MIKGSVENNIKLPEVGSFESALGKTIKSLTLKLVGMVKEGKLSGQVLNVGKKKGGRLRRSISPAFENNGQTGIVGSNVSYAKVHEYGGAITIPEHMRMMTKAWGKLVKSPRQITVKSHIANYPERSFLRSALKDLEPEIQPAIKQAIREAIKL